MFHVKHFTLFFIIKNKYTIIILLVYKILIN